MHFYCPGKWQKFPIPSGTHLVSGCSSRLLLAGQLFFSEGLHEDRDSREQSVAIYPFPENIIKPLSYLNELTFGKKKKKRWVSHIIDINSSTQDFLKVYIKQGKTNAERADLGQFIKVWEMASRWRELFAAGW